MFGEAASVVGQIATRDNVPRVCVSWDLFSVFLMENFSCTRGQTTSTKFSFIIYLANDHFPPFLGREEYDIGYFGREL